MAAGGTLGEEPGAGATWEELDAEGLQYFVQSKKHIALATLNRAADLPGGCGWPVHAHRAECRLHLLDFPGAVEDAVQAVDLHAQRTQGQQLAPAAALMTASDALWREAELEDALVLASRLHARRTYLYEGFHLPDERKLRVDGLRADIRDAMGPTVGRVLRRDLVRDMMKHKGIISRRLTAGQRLSWVTISTIQAEPPLRRTDTDVGTDTPLPLPIIWGVTPLTAQTSDSEDENAEEEDEEGEESEKDVDDQDGKKDGDESEEKKEEEDGADEGKDEAEMEVAAEERAEDGGDGEGVDGAQADEDETKMSQKTAGVEPTQGPKWGWLRQIPGHDHICADPKVAEQADRIAELRVLQRLEMDRAFLRKLLGDMESVQERPGQQRIAECPPDPGPNLAKWQDDGLRVETIPPQDVLARSKWESQDIVRKVLGELHHMVKAELRCKPRYLRPVPGRGPSPKMRTERAKLRQERALSTVRFMLRRVHDSLRNGLYRDVEGTGGRLCAFLERLPCKIFPDRLEALARTLDCRAVAARKRNNSKLAIEMQKARCTLAVNHGMAALYARALDEVSLLLFSVADYTLAEASWTERLSRLQQKQNELGDDAGEDNAGQDAAGQDLAEEKAQVLFQLARCCFVAGHLRMAGAKGSKKAVVVSKKDHRSEPPEFYLGTKEPVAPAPSELSSESDEFDANAGLPEAEVGEEREEMFECKWRGACRWTPKLLGYDLGDAADMEEPVEQGPVELKPYSVEACMRLIMDELETQDPLLEFGHLVAVERFPDPQDASRPYPLLPPDFDMEDNVMNKNYALFESRFREACRFFVGEISGVSPAAEVAEGANETKPPPATPEPEPLPAAAEEPQGQQ